MSFNSVGEENEENLVNDGVKRPICSRCGCNNHTVDKWKAKYHADGTVLRNMGDIEEVECEINNEVIAGITTQNGEFFCYSNALMFVQPDVSSLMDQSNASSRIIGIPNTWILLDSQSTINVF